MPVPPDPIGEAPTAVHHVVLELVRQDDVDDPYAMPERPQTYLRRMPDGGYQTSALRWTRRFTDQLDAVRAGAQAEARQQVGRTLRAFLDGLGWATVDARIQAAVAAGERVVITLRSAAAELWRLQWALTAHGPAEAHLGALPGVLIQLAWPETHTAAPAQRSQGPERVLVAWASPTRPVPADAHIQAIAHAARAGALPFDARQDVVSRASPAALVERLEAARPERPISVLHLLCHGGAVGDAFGLTFHGPDGATVVDAGQLRALLAPFTDRVRLVVIAACDSGNDGPWASTLGSVAQALHRVGFAAVVASQRPLSGAASVTFTKHFYRALLEAPSSVEQAFVAARQALLAEASEHADWAGLQLWARADDGLDTRPVTFRPYRGLLPFEAEHARFYFGRDPQRAEVLADLQALQVAGQPRLLVVAAASGTGKSSLVRAAVLPDLRAQLPGCRVAILKPGLHPGVALERTLQRWTAAGGDGPRVLVVDQFEELFTLAPAAEVEPFCQQLWALAGGSEPVVVLVTIRVDFIGHCGQVSLTPELRLDRICYDERHQVFVPMMAPADLRQAIEGPAARVGLTLADGLADRMLRDVSAEPGHLPMLQYALDQLWQRREGDTLTHAAYEAIGGVTGALTGHADQVVDALADDARAQARRLLTELVDLSADREHATRRRVPEATIQPSEPAQAEALAHAADTLVDARLLFRSEDAEGEHALEIAHEALIRRWDRLSEWVAADREKLLVTREVVESARKHQAHDSLFQGNQLGHALDVVARYPGALPADVVQVIEASQAARDTRRRRTRIQRQLFIGFLIATSVIMVTLRATAVSNEEKAQAATRAAERLKDDALASRAEAVKSLQRAKRAGLLAFTLKALSETPALAVAALLELGPNRAHDERAQALARSLVPGPAAVYDVPSPPAVDLHFAPDSRHFAHDGRVYSLPSFLMKHRHVGRFLGFLDGGSAFAALDHRAASLILQRIGGETHTVRVPGYDMLDPDRPDLFIEEDRRAVTMMTVDRNEDTCHLRSLSMATPTWSNPRSCLGWVGGGERPANARPKSEARGDAPARHFPSDVVLKISPDGRWVPARSLLHGPCSTCSRTEA